ncbi:MAG: carboxypeptidase regulatory-like domain-containing protein [Pirellulaceae bacterium]|nr:carboxypeptidase regulatory-like domain-containing protein [Pirellulaceae bacterium]
MQLKNPASTQFFISSGSTWSMLLCPRRQAVLGLFVLSVMVPMLAGCSADGGDNPDWPKRYPVSGVVTYQDKPVEGADVAFFSNDGKSTSTGKTDSSGAFVLTTYLDKDGAVAGSHVVTIRRVDVVDPTPKDVDLSAGGVALPPKITWIVPEKYSLPNKSGLTANVSEGQPNEFRFDLK